MPPRWIKTRRGIKNSPSGLRTDMGGAILLMTVTRGAHFEIKVDGIVRTHRDERDTAIEAARFLQQARTRQRRRWRSAVRRPRSRWPNSNS
jgi:hypothetical protein